MTKDKLKVLMVAGGDSSERAVSLDSGKSIYAALVSLGHDVLIADPAREDVGAVEDPEVFFSGTKIAETPPDMVDNPHVARRAFVAGVLSKFHDLGCDILFNALHGGAGEDGTVQAVCDYLGVPYTGSNARSCAIAMDKVTSKQLARMANVPVAKDIIIMKPKDNTRAIERRVERELTFPVVVKPNNEGSSVGVTIVHDRTELAGAIELARTFGGPYMIEKFIPGREITASMLDDAELPLIEIRPKDGGFFDYKNKYQKGACEYIVPAEVKPFTAESIATSAKSVYKALGCSGYARIDFRLSPDSYHFFLEANTLPGMTSNSLVPKAARAAGIEFDELIDRILRLALNTPRDTVKRS